MSEHVIIGYSGHAYVVLDAAKKSGLNVVAYTEKKMQSINPFHLEYLGNEGEENFGGWNYGYDFILGIGDNKIRENITDLLITKKEKLQSIVHPSAVIASSVKIGNGTFIAAGAMINPLAEIGKSVIINTGAIVEHECQIGSYAHIAPGAVLAGNVKVGQRSFVGANAVIKEGVEIGNDVVIGAGAVLIRDVKDNDKQVGNPARKIN